MASLQQNITIRKKEHIISTLNKIYIDIEKYQIKKKRLFFCQFLNVLYNYNITLNQSAHFPIKIDLDIIDTESNIKLLEELLNNKQLKQLFQCRSLRSIGKNDKKRLQNIIRQMATECNLIMERKPHTYYNHITKTKKTKQYYLIKYNNS